jgi:hypothetical protein
MVFSEVRHEMHSHVGSRGTDLQLYVRVQHPYAHAPRGRGRASPWPGHVAHGREPTPPLALQRA